MYLKIAMKKDCFQILEQSSGHFNRFASNGVQILTCSMPEIRAHSRTFFLRGTATSTDLRVLQYPSDGSFIDFFRALEEVVDSFVVCLR